MLDDILIYMIVWNAKSKKLLLVLFVVIILVGSGMFLYPKYFSPVTAPSSPSPIVPSEITTAPTASSQSGKPVEITGKMVCLPHKNTSGPQTMECAYGLQDTKGTYYALRDTDPTYKNISGVPMNTTVSVSGVFTSLEDTKYQSIGTIVVTAIIQ